jgi:multidrug resistance efflux pump
MKLPRFLERLTEQQRRYAYTGGAVLLALVLGWALWWHFFRSPWTRDGRVRVEIVDMASQVAGIVTQLPVIDNQPVKKNDILFQIDDTDYKLALAQAEATVRSRQSDLKVQQEEYARRAKLGLQAISLEEKQSYESQALVAEANLDAALAAREQARVNLDRCVIKSPVNGYVTNLSLRIGDYATPGQRKLSLVDSDSFYVLGYFEETKLSNIHTGDFAHIRLMGWGPEVTGHVEGISRAIADTNSEINGQGLANVSPIFTWVRLAQRIPIRIAIDHVPKEVIIAAGQTCTIVLGAPRGKRPDENPPAKLQ